MSPLTLPIRRTSVVIVLLAAFPWISQAITVVPVPQNPLDSTVPHPAYNRHVTTCKAIARGCTQATVYFHWDFDGNGTWDPCNGRTPAVMPYYWYTDTPYNLDGRYQYPDLDSAQSPNRSYMAVIEVTCTAPPGGFAVTSAFGVYPVLLNAETPWPENAETATNEQLAWMRLAAADDALWFLHRAMTRSGSGTSTITGYVTVGAGESGGQTALFLLAAQALGHRGAYPPGTYNAYGMPIPPGFIEENNARYAQDPYAEDVIRGINYLLGTTSSMTIPAVDEADDGTTPIPATNDAKGYYLGGSSSDQETGRLSLPVAAIAASGLAGTVGQVSNSLVNGKTFEYIVQQLVDFGVAAQIDATAGGLPQMGGWSWQPCFDCTYSSGACAYIDAHWILALQTAEQKMGGSGVYVNQACKGGLANVLVRNQDPDGGPMYMDGYPVSFYEPVGGSIYGCRWLGWDAWDASDPTPTGYPYFPATRGEARTRFDGYMAFANTNWNMAGGLGDWVDPTRAIWKDGNPADTTPGYQTDIWTMSGSLLRAGLSYSGATPAIAMVGSHDWRRDFMMSLVEGQLIDTGGGHYQEPGNSMVNGFLADAGATGHALLMANVGNVPPVAALSSASCVPGPCSGDCCATTLTNVSFDIAASDLDGTVTEIVLDYGDGTPPVSLAPHEVPVRRYATSGDYESVVTVTDDYGGVGMDVLSMVVSDVVPGWADLQGPATVTVDAGVQSDPIYGQVLLSGVTNAVGQGAGIDAMLGYGGDGSDPASDPSWQWSAAMYIGDEGNNDEYVGTVTVLDVGLYDYCFRFRYSGGPWLYGDLDGSTNGYSPNQAGALTVLNGSSAVGTSGAPLPLRLHTPRPNPSTGKTLITFDLPSECGLILEVLDPTGRLVRTLIDVASRSPGRHEVWWDGRDARDREMAPGVYFCRMRAGGAALVERLVLLK